MEQGATLTFFAEGALPAALSDLILFFFWQEAQGNPQSTLVYSYFLASTKQGEKETSFL